MNIYVEVDDFDRMAYFCAQTELFAKILRKVEKCNCVRKVTVKLSKSRITIAKNNKIAESAQQVEKLTF